METAAITDTRAGEQEWKDISVPLRDGMLHWPDNPEVKVTRTLSLSRGDDANVSKISLGVHTGTHVDAPVHFIPGAAGVDSLPLTSTVGVARVLEILDPRAIRVEELRRHDIQAGERILFRTANSSRDWPRAEFQPDFVYLSLEGARYLAGLRVRTVGIDYLSIGSAEEGEPTHRALLDAGVCIIEGLVLSHVSAGTYDLVCLPLRLEGGDGAPARAILRRR
ncbi:cyclase family protein [Corallococcus sp. M34]|uniref:cyclase family protein n=1 Tax=Citreicoccus inhibens TaxID=2849499 RepID=UPI001C237782|nr:cyclase family protein [Citreicoccus inhibens]MBU8896958.1 cyclase family protein [Citreicoccus inhibens]